MDREKNYCNIHFVLFCLIFSCSLFVTKVSFAAAEGYAMYVWSTGFDSTVSGCDTAKLLAWDRINDPQCYTSNWDTPEVRQWLWDTAKRSGREIKHLYVSGFKTRLAIGYATGNCQEPDVEFVRETIREAHCQVPGIAIYALFSDSDSAVSEQNWIPFVVWYNDTCAQRPDEKFDGIAINNEAWSVIKCTGDPDAERTYLDQLQTIVSLAALQQDGTLLTHYSIGWHWSQCSGVPYELEWKGVTQAPTLHMIDIFDSVDVQVAFVDAATVASRAMTAGYDYAVSEGKPFFVTSYTNKAADTECTITHFPYYCSYTWSNSRRSDTYMMQSIFDSFVAEGIPEALPCIHYFRGVYSSGGHGDWPSYYSGSVLSCTPLVYDAGFFNPLDKDEYSWPEQPEATLYEVARAASPQFDLECTIVATISSTAIVDSTQPFSPSVLYYMVRTVSPGVGSWGYTSNGVERTGTCL